MVTRSILTRRSSPQPRAAAGFTLIELLTVVAIIGIITTVVTVSLSSARKQARDVRRKADLQTIQSAVEVYANAHAGAVPAATSQQTSATTPWLPALVADGLLSSVPLDPLRKPNTAPNVYTYQTGSGSLANSYALDTVLEAESPLNPNLAFDPSAKAMTDPLFFSTGTYLSSSTVHYRVSSGR
jgi:prepilin-type N-terminal cleavage/methylation domain-containing protein